MILRAIALFALLFVAACSSAPPQKVVQSPGSGLEQSERYASREVPAQGRLVADYLVIDKSERMLVAYRSGRPIKAYSGLQFGGSPAGHKRFEGDQRTPEGTYTIDWRNPNSSYHLSLHISYPNSADRAFAEQAGRSPGGDIFIHGQPNTLPLGRMPGDWTAGCIAVSNAEMEELWQLVPNNTPIEIRP